METQNLQASPELQFIEPEVDVFLKYQSTAIGGGVSYGWAVTVGATGSSGFTLIASIISDVLRSENVHAHKTSQRLLNSASFVQTKFYTAFRVEYLLRIIRKYSLSNKNMFKRFIEIILSPSVQIITPNLLIGNNHEVK